MFNALLKIPPNFYASILKAADWWLGSCQEVYYAVNYCQIWFWNWSIWKRYWPHPFSYLIHSASFGYFHCGQVKAGKHNCNLAKAQNILSKNLRKSILSGRMVASFALLEKQVLKLSVSICFHRAKLFLCLTSQKLKTFGFCGTFYKYRPPYPDPEKRIDDPVW